MSLPAKTPRRLLWMAAALGTLGVQACGSDFTEYYEIDRLRLLAMSAEHPWLTETATAGPTSTELSALIANAPGTSTSAARFEWSWCPVRAGSTGDSNVGPYECAFGPRELSEILGQPADPNAPSEFPMGTAATASLDYPLPSSQVRAFCEQIQGVELPAFISVPNCDGGYPVSVRLIVRQGSEEVIGIKDVRLTYEDSPVINTNPQITRLTVTSSVTEGELVLSDSGPTELLRNVEYSLHAEFSDAQSETYTREDPTTKMDEQVRETLVLSWFIEGGKLDNTRRSWLPNEDASAEARERAGGNVWTTPKAVDFSPTDTRIHVVIRDGREGTTFISRRITFKEP